MSTVLTVVCPEHLGTVLSLVYIHCPLLLQAPCLTLPTQQQHFTPCRSELASTPTLDTSPLPASGLSLSSEAPGHPWRPCPANHHHSFHPDTLCEATAACTHPPASTPSLCPGPQPQPSILPEFSASLHPVSPHHTWSPEASSQKSHLGSVQLGSVQQHALFN